MFLAAILVVTLGFMAIYLTKKPKGPASVTESDKEIQEIQQQSKSDEVMEIEKDLYTTDLNDLDKELQDIENELETTVY